MKKTTFLLSLILLACTLVLPVSAAESTVYVDGTGATPGAFTTLSEAAEAVADGGTIIVCGDVATPRDKGTTLPANTLTITSQNGAKLTLGRVTYLSGPLTLRDITLVNAAPNAVDYIYTCGNDLTVESSVKTEPSEETSRNLSIFTGAGVDAFCEVVDQKINVYGGTWRLIYFGNWSGTYLGAKTTVTVDGATIENDVKFGNFGGGNNFCENNSFILKSGSVGKISSKDASIITNITLMGGTVNTLECKAKVTAEEKVYICSASADIDVADGILTGVESADDFLYNTYYRESATVTDTPTTEATTTIAPATNIPATEAPEGGESTPATGSFAGYVFAAAIVSLITIAFISKKRLKA